MASRSSAVAGRTSLTVDSVFPTIEVMDRIELRGMSFQGRHGARPTEREQPQEFRVDIEVEAELAEPARTDRLEDTVDYTRLRAIAREVIEGPSHQLIEALAS